MLKLDDFSDIDDLQLLEGLSLDEINELSEAIDPEVSFQFEKWTWLICSKIIRHSIFWSCHSSVGLLLLV